MAAAELSRRLKHEAIRLGLDAVGIAPAVTPAGYPNYLTWLRKGHAAGMAYMEREPSLRAQPECVLEGVRSVIVASLVYGSAHAAVPPGRASGRIARYAQGADYHQVLKARLNRLLEWLEHEAPGARGRAVVDTAPILERDYAQAAGLGWIAKNTMLIHRRLGSFTFLGCLLTDLELEYDEPSAKSYCGTCTRCLDACPTQAFAGPYELDARRCISYWTIEHRGIVPDETASALGGWAFGCDICQEVCPWNRKAPAGGDPELEPRPEWANPDLIAWLERSAAEWKTRLAGSALERAGRRGLVRNAALVLGGRRAIEAVEPLAKLLKSTQTHPVVRAAARWALKQIGTPRALEALADSANDQAQTPVTPDRRVALDPPA